MKVYFLSNNQSTRSGFAHGFAKMAEAEGSLKKELQKRCVCSLFFMLVLSSTDTKSLCLFLHLFIIPALIGVSWPQQTFLVSIFLVFVASTGILASRADENNNNIIFSSALQATNI